MKIVAVVGTGSGCGKTTVACRILRAIPGLGAVKISPREGESRVEWGGGEPGKDTALFAGCNAVRVARISGPRALVATTWRGIEGRFADCSGVVVEGTSALELPGERFAVFVVGKTRENGRAARDNALAAGADAIVGRSSPADAASLVERVRAFLARGASR